MSEFQNQSESDYKEYEQHELRALTTIDRPLFETSSDQTWEEIYDEISDKVTSGEMTRTLQGQIYLLAQRWGHAIDMRKDFFPDVDYELAGFNAAETMPQALTGFQVTNAFALLVKTHVDGQKIADSIALKKGRNPRNGYLFNYGSRQMEMVDVCLTDFRTSEIFPTRYAKPKPSGFGKFSQN